MSLKSKLRDWLLNDRNGANKIKASSIDNYAATAKTADSGSLNGNGMTFTVYPAEGGCVLEFRHYDRGTDRMSNRLYLINEGEDFATHVAHAVTIESMRR